MRLLSRRAIMLFWMALTAPLALVFLVLAVVNWAGSPYGYFDKHLFSDVLGWGWP